jgi:DNA-binding winged helix-turn-helix (wHTH) protein/tetratricopeptide (TPR) repeat protein
MEAPARTRRTRFGVFEVDLRSGALYKHGIRLKLQDQPFHVLEILLERPGDVVTREELRQKLWPADTFVDFDTGLNSAIKKLRDVLGDSAEEPRYIETLPRRGYRLIATVENGESPPPRGHHEKLAVMPPQPMPRAWFKNRSFIIGTVVALLTTGTVATWPVFFTRPGLTETDTILLASFINKTGDPIFDDSLDKALEVKLAESPFLSLLPEADVRSTMGMMRHDPKERVTQELGIEICKRRGLKAVVVPEIVAVGSGYLITVQAIDAQSQKTIARRQEEAKTKNEVIAALGKAGSQLRKRLGESLSSLEKYDAPLDLATTGSLEALQAYRAGQTLYRSGKQQEAIPLFERAVELDPQFCSAFDMLGMAYNNVGDQQASRKNFAKAFELKDRRLTQEENFRITALYHSAITGNLEKELAVLVLYKQAYPRSADAYNLSGRAHALLGEMDSALQDFYWAIDHSAVPSVSYHINAAHALLILGRFDEAKKILDQLSQKGSLAPSQKVMRYRIASIQNDTATMERLARETRADDARWLDLQLKLAFLRGDLRKLNSLSNGLVEQQNHAGRTANAADQLAWHGRVEAYVGRYALARELCHKAVKASEDHEYVFDSCAKALGNAGDEAGATEMAERKDRLLPEDTRNQKMCQPEFHSIIERMRGNAAGAVDLLLPAEQYEQAVATDIPYELAQAYLAAGQGAKAAAEFEKILDHYGWEDWELFAPLAQLGLARAYAMQGDRDNSRKAYDDFFTMWKDADPDIPILRQARAEYKKLTTTGSASISESGKGSKPVSRAAAL